jgi:hypothetical protein
MKVASINPLKLNDPEAKRSVYPTCFFVTLEDS